MLKVVSRHFHLDYLWKLIQWFEVVWLFKYFSFSFEYGIEQKAQIINPWVEKQQELNFWPNNVN